MKIAIVHYHLKPGGVTSVIKHQLDVLKDECEILLLTGELPETPFYPRTCLIPGLGYSQTSNTLPLPEDVANTIANEIYSAFGGPCDVVHIHNPMLAKNRKLLRILKCLQQKGLSLFLQVHDFAEEGRPASYYTEESYVANCHYGVINSRDYRLLLQSGLHPKGLHLIPNAVNPIQRDSEEKEPKHRILYPVRAIRRKNIGESILLSLFFKDKTLSITLPPNSDTDIQSYTGWKSFSHRQGLVVEFDSGLNTDFSSLVSSADYFISTSISEGFGFLFLEPWTANKVLWGRAIPDICNDFSSNGVQLDHLYKHINVPISWFNEKALYRAFVSCISENAKKFNFPLDERKASKSFKRKLDSGVVDFGLLNEKFQKQALLKILGQKKDKTLLINVNPFLQRPGYIPDSQSLISHNNEAIRHRYSKIHYKKNLLDIYRKVSRNSITHCIDKNRLTSFFMNPEHFSLLQWGDYVE